IQVGEALSRKLSDDDTGEMLKKLSIFWKEQKLGRIEVESLEPLTIRIYDCFECQDLPFIGRPACSFDSGILQTVFSDHFKGDMSVKETNCYAMGDGYCRFEIK